MRYDERAISPPAIPFPSTMSGDDVGRALSPLSRKPEVSRSRHFAEGEASVARRRPVVTVSADGYENVFREKFRRDRDGLGTRDRFTRSSGIASRLPVVHTNICTHTRARVRHASETSSYSSIRNTFSTTLATWSLLIGYRRRAGSTCEDPRDATLVDHRLVRARRTLVNFRKANRTLARSVTD